MDNRYKTSDRVAYIPRDLKQTGTFRGFLKTRNLIEAGVSLLFYLPFHLICKLIFSGGLMQIIPAVALTAIIAVICVLGIKGMSVTQFIKQRLKYKATADEFYFYIPRPYEKGGKSNEKN